MNGEAQVHIEPLLADSETAAKLLGISKRHFLSMEKDGKIGPLPVVYFGRRILWSVAELKEWVQQGCKNRDQWSQWRVEQNEG